jgi:hypothetical protein
MGIKKMLGYLSIAAITLSMAGCSANSDTEPAAPANVKAVQDFLKSKKLTVKKTGFYGMLTVNGIKEAKWIDTANEKDKTTKDAVAAEMAFALEFINDTAVTVKKKDKSYAGTYAVDDKVDEEGEEQPGIKLRISFPDPEFSFGSTPMVVTYTYAVLGLDAKRIMLETPRSINRQKLISIMSE